MVDLAFKMNKIKTKYNVLAQCKIDTLSVSCPLLAIYQMLNVSFSRRGRLSMSL